MIWNSWNRWKGNSGKMLIKDISPRMGLPGGKVVIRGKNFNARGIKDFNINFSNTRGSMEGASDNMMLALIPPNTLSGDVYLEVDGVKSNKYYFRVPQAMIGGLHMIDNPVVGLDGSIYATYSGSRGEQTPISVYKINKNKEKEVYITGIMNATSLLIDGEDLYIASRFDGKLYKSEEKGKYELFSQGLGVAFGLAMNSKKDLHVGDRGGSIFRLDGGGKASFLASIPQSYIAFHLNFDSGDNLFVSNPVHMGENFIYRIDRDTGKREVYYNALSLFHGFSIDKDDNLYLAETKRNQSRVIKIKGGKFVSTVLTGVNFIGIAFDRDDNLIVATSMFLYIIEKGNY